MVRVKNSKIHGKGLFSTEKISKGTILGTCKTKKTKKNNMYTLWVEDQPRDITCDFKYINHSAKPNVVYYDDYTVVAIRKIKQGEELTHDYGW